MSGNILADAAFHESLRVRKRFNIALGSQNQICRHFMIVPVASERNGNNLFSVNGLVRQDNSHRIKRSMIHIVGRDILKTDIAQACGKGFSGSV